MTQDLFAKNNLPPKEQWPELINLEKFDYPQNLNCITKLLDDAVDEGFGESPCLRTAGQIWTYRQLLEKSNQIAHVLQEDLGMIPGNRILLRSANNPMMVACWCAVLKAGGIVVSTMPLLRAKELTQVVEKAEITIALSDHRLSEEMEEAGSKCSMLEKVVYFQGPVGDPSGELEALMAGKPFVFENVDTAADDICLIAFTSGTTGKPKGTLHFHRDIMIICDGYCKEVVRPRQSDIVIGSPPLAFTFGLGGILLSALWARASSVLLEAASPAELLKAIDQFRATIVFTAPTAYRFMLNWVEDYDLSHLRVCVSAGEALPLATWQAWQQKTGIEILDGLGSTEMLHVFISSPPGNIRPGATGKPILNYEARIVDDEGSPVPTGTVGLLAVRGPTGCRYLADERQKNYVRQGWNLTGDAYKVDEDGYFWYQARSDDMIISAGYNIAPPEVENALLQHEAVLECAVVAEPDEERGNIVKAFVVLRDPDAKNKEELIGDFQKFVKNSIAPYKYPRKIEFIESIPKTETGKTQRFKLRNK
ncbi:MAG: AMP-binding protein [SAR324 cluster bacterium]|nr:AMP-binding protein [SAR324 cluster bacterium]